MSQDYPGLTEYGLSPNDFKNEQGDIQVAVDAATFITSGMFFNSSLKLLILFPMVFARRSTKMFSLSNPRSLSIMN